MFDIAISSTKRKLRLGLNEISHVSVVLLLKDNLKQIWQTTTTSSPDMFVIFFYFTSSHGWDDGNKEWAAKKGNCPVLWVLGGPPGPELCGTKRVSAARQTQNGISGLFNGLQCYKYFIEQHSGRRRSECIIKIKQEILCRKILPWLSHRWPGKSDASRQRGLRGLCCGAKRVSSQVR